MNQRGFTLLELVIAIAVTGLIGAGIALTLGNSLTQYFIVEGRASLGTEAELAMRRMVEELHHADFGSVAAPLPHCLEFLSPLSTTDQAFFCDGNRLFLYEGPTPCSVTPPAESRHLLSNRVENCAFSRTDNLVQITLTLQHPSVGDEIHLYQRVHLEGLLQ